MGNQLGVDELLVNVPNGEGVFDPLWFLFISIEGSDRAEKLTILVIVQEALFLDTVVRNVLYVEIVS